MTVFAFGRSIKIRAIVLPRISRAILPALFVLGALPLYVLTPAPLADWASHLARVSVTNQFLHGASFWVARYNYQGLLLPNAILDAVVLGLVRVGLNIDSAGYCFLALCYFSFVGGFSRLSRVYGLPSIVSVSLGILLFYTGNVVYGLVNFVTGVGLTMFAASYWLEDNANFRRRCLIALVATPAIMFCHILAALLFVAICGGFTLLRPGQHEGSLDLRSLRRRSVSMIPTMIALTISVVGYKLSASGADKLIIGYDGAPGASSIVRGKLRQAAEGLSSGNQLADLILSVVVAGILWCIWQRRSCLRWAEVVPLAGLAVLPFLAPFRVGEGMLLDTRLFVIPILIGVAALPWANRLGAKWQYAIVAACIFRSLVLASSWASYASIYDELQTAFSRLPPGSTLLSAYSDEPGFYKDKQPPLRNSATLAVKYGVFVPSMFAEPTQQPLAILPQWRPTWLWEHSANARSPSALASVRDRAKRFCGIDPLSHLFILHVTKMPPFTIESECSTP